MNRRHLLKSIASLAAAPVLVKGKEVGKQFAIDPQAKYMVFVDMDMIAPQDLANYETALPPGTVIHGVLVQRGKTVDDAIRIYKVE